MKPHKQIAVIFNKYGARIVVGDISAYKASHDVVINPDLSAVKGLPPHYWKLEDGKVVPKDSSERRDIDKLHGQNPFNSLKVQVFKKRPSFWYTALFISLGIFISELLRLIVLILPK